MLHNVYDVSMNPIVYVIHVVVEVAKLHETSKECLHTGICIDNALVVFYLAGLALWLCGWTTSLGHSLRDTTQSHTGSRTD